MKHLLVLSLILNVAPTYESDHGSITYAYNLVC